MSNKTEFSRLVWKRSTATGVVPTVPTGTTIDNTWLDTDILVGEAFLNVTDDRLWFRTNNGITELFFSGATDIYTTGATVAADTVFFDTNYTLSAYSVSLSGISDLNNYTTAATLTSNVLSFDTIDSLSAYSVDLSSIIPTGDTYTTGVTIAGNTLFYDRTNLLSAYSIDISSIVGDYLPLVGGTMTGGISGTTLFLTDTTGGAATEYIGRDANGQIVGAATPLIADIYLPKSGGTMTGGLSATTVFISDVGSGTSVYNLGLDSTGQVVTGTTGGGSGSGSYTDNGLNTYTGGTSGFTSVNISGGTFDNITVTGDTVLGEISATTFSIINSGATARNYTDYSGNLIETGVTNSAIVAGSGNTINKDLRNVFVSGVDLTGSTNDTAYFSNLNVGGSTIEAPTAGNYLSITGDTVISLTSYPITESFALSDETTQITSGSTKLTFYAPYAFTVTEVKGSISESGSTATVMDINKNGTSILTSDKITVDSNEFKSVDASVQPGILTSAIAVDDKLTFDIDQAGTGAAGAKIYIIGTRTL